MRYFQLTGLLLGLALTWGALISPVAAEAASAEEINRDVKRAIDKLYAKSASAGKLGKKAQGILVFPAIVREALSSVVSMGKGPFSREGRRSGTTTQFRFPMDCRRACRSTGMRCFS